jgi:membrane glycosyltransferase
MKMRQSIAQFEAAFHEQAVEDRLRREEVKHSVTQRARVRRAERVQKHGTLRFFTLVSVIILTAVIVTIVMFETLARVAG